MQPKTPPYNADQITAQGEQQLLGEKTCRINQLLAQGTLWHASRGSVSESTDTQPNNNSRFTTSGFSTIDALLHYRGWPLGQLIECLQPSCSQTLLTPFLPAIQNMAVMPQADHAKKQGPKNKQADIILINPPHIPYQYGWTKKLPLNIYVISTHTLKDTLWACEQTLRSDCSQSVFIWLPEKNIPFSQLRKLQLAAQHTHKIFIAFRPQQLAQQNSPAALRIKVSPVQYKQKTALQLHILKQPGCWGGQKTTIHWHSSLQHPFIPAKYWPAYQTQQQLSQGNLNTRNKKINPLSKQEQSTAFGYSRHTEKKWS